MRLASLTATSILSLPADSYIYKIVDLNNNNLAAISSDDSLRLVDSRSLREIAGGVLEHVHDGVTCLQVVGHDPNSVLTAGRDAIVRQYDLRSGQTTLQLSHDSNAPYLSLASHGTNIAAGTELSHSEAAVLIWDTRSPHKPLQTYIESHNDDVTELQFHPTRPRCLLSGSTDGLVNIYDISISDEDDALLQVQNHGSSINHAGFLSSLSSPADFSFALSHDEMFSVYQLNEPVDDSTDESPAPKQFGDLRPKLDCEYIVDVIPSGGGGGGVEAIVGAGSHSKQHLDLVPLRRTTTKTKTTTTHDWSFDPGQTIRLSGAHGEEIVRSIQINDEDGTIFTAGEDGLVKAWRTAAAEGDEEQERTEAERPTKKTKRKKKGVAGGGSETGRFQPY